MKIELSLQEFYTLCITIAACTWFIQSFILKRSNTKKSYKKGKNTSNQFSPKKWTPDGWYFDEKKKRWIAPDYTNKEEK